MRFSVIYGALGLTRLLYGRTDYAFDRIRQIRLSGRYRIRFHVRNEVIRRRRRRVPYTVVIGKDARNISRNADVRAVFKLRHNIDVLRADSEINISVFARIGRVKYCFVFVIVNLRGTAEVQFTGRVNTDSVQAVIILYNTARQGEFAGCGNIHTAAAAGSNVCACCRIAGNFTAEHIELACGINAACALCSVVRNFTACHRETGVSAVINVNTAGIVGTLVSVDCASVHLERAVSAVKHTACQAAVARNTYFIGFECADHAAVERKRTVVVNTAAACAVHGVIGDPAAVHREYSVAVDIYAACGISRRVVTAGKHTCLCRRKIVEDQFAGNKHHITVRANVCKSAVQCITVKIEGNARANGHV